MGFILSSTIQQNDSRAEPSRAEPSRAEPSRAEPSRAEPSRAEPSWLTPFLCKFFTLFSPLRNDKGFSIMGALIAAGMMGGLALVLAEITGQQHAAQKMADTRMEVNALSQRIVRTLYDGDACKKTLEQGQGSRNIQGSPGGDFTMRTIKNKDGNDIIKTIAEDATVTYGNGLLKVSSIKMGKISVTGTQAEAEMVVVFRRESKAILGQKTVERSFPVTLNLDTSSSPPTLASCVSDAGAYMKGMCTALGGQWVGSGCTLNNPVAGKRCTTPGQMVTGFNNQGDPVCASPPPSPFDNFAPCQNGEMVDFTGGSPRCVAAPTGGGGGFTPPGGCATNGVMKFDGTSWNCGTDDTGGGGGLSSVPGADSVKNKDCGDDKILRGFDGNGNPICAQGCSGNDVFSGRFDSTTGDAICVSKSGGGVEIRAVFTGCTAPIPPPGNLGKAVWMRRYTALRQGVDFSLAYPGVTIPASRNNSYLSSADSTAMTSWSCPPGSTLSANVAGSGHNFYYMRSIAQYPSYPSFGSSVSSGSSIFIYLRCCT